MVSEEYIAVNNPIKILITNIRTGKLQLKYSPPDGSPQFTIPDPVIIVSVIVADFIVQVNIAHVVVLEVDSVDPVKWYLGCFILLSIVHLPMIFKPLGFLACIR